MEQEPKRQKKDQSTKRKQVTSEMSQESTPMKVPSAGGPDDAPSPADNDDLRKLMDRMETAKQEIELLRKEINKLEDNQNALQWFNMSYWFGGNSTRINSKEQQIVQIQSQLAAQEKQRTALLEERREAQGAKRQRMGDGGAGDASVFGDFPESFEDPLPPKLDGTHSYIGLDSKCEKIWEHVKKHAGKETNLQERVPPVMISSMARSGKTTTLVHAALQEMDDYTCVFVSFNGQSGFTHQQKESDYAAFCRQLTTTLLPKTLSGTSITAVDDKKLFKYLGNCKTNFILFVDELNALTKEQQPSEKLADVLRKEFLDKAGRYLVFTAHWPMDLNHRLGVSSINSTRVQLPVTVAKISTLKEVTTMLENQHASITKVVMCGGLAGLLYSHETGRIALRQRMVQVRDGKEIEIKELLPQLYLEFCSGVEQKKLTDAGYRVFTYQDENHCPIWPLMCVNEFMEICGRSDCAALIRHSITKAGLPEEGDGKMWEYVVGVGIITLLLAARNGLVLTAIQKKYLGLASTAIKEADNIQFLYLPTDCETLNVADKLASQECQKSKDSTTFIVCYPTSTKFPVFDVLLYVFEEKTAKVGYQMKAGSETEGTNHPVPAGWNGIWVCGKPAESIRRNTEWERLTLQDLIEFLPYSLRPLIPKHVQEALQAT